MPEPTQPLEWTPERIARQQGLQIRLLSLLAKRVVEDLRKKQQAPPATSPGYEVRPLQLDPDDNYP